VVWPGKTVVPAHSVLPSPGIVWPGPTAAINPSGDTAWTLAYHQAAWTRPRVNNIPHVVIDRCESAGCHRATHTRPDHTSDQIHHSASVHIGTQYSCHELSKAAGTEWGIGVAAGGKVGVQLIHTQLGHALRENSLLQSAPCSPKQAATESPQTPSAASRALLCFSLAALLLLLQCLFAGIAPSLVLLSRPLLLLLLLLLGVLSSTGWQQQLLIISTLPQLLLLRGVFILPLLLKRLSFQNLLKRSIL
jgi:hypothetical protein